MRQLPQQSLQTATQPRRARKKKSRQKSTAQPLLNMSQVLNEINHSIKSPSKRQPDKPRNFLRQNPDLSNQAKKLIGRNLQQSSVYIPDASNGSLFALDTPYVLPNSLKSQVFSHSPVRENPRNV